MTAADGEQLAGVVWGPDGDFDGERFASPEVQTAVEAAQEKEWQALDAAQGDRQVDQEQGEAIMQTAMENVDDSEVSRTRLQSLRGDVADAGTAFDDAALRHLGFTLPHDWNGRVMVQGMATGEMNGEQQEASAEMPREA